jgi:hypothetical protein
MEEDRDMPDQPEWRVERYEDQDDPFISIQWYVMQGNVMIAHCEMEAYAQRILIEHQRHETYEQVLQHISSMSDDVHDLQAAVDAALRALEMPD